MYSGAYTSQRFSPLDQISSTNVSRLKPLWVYQPPGVGSLEGTPVVADGVMYGISGGEAGIRGFLDAYDARTGKQVWRLHTVPSPGEPGSETWPGDSWVHGAGATWLTGSYDPALKLLYWGTGNPGPDWNGDARKGDNLFTCSLLAIDVETGKMRWHFQFTPHDVHDWDANQIPVLVDADFGGRPRSLVVMANPNGFFYVLDRKTGDYLLGAPRSRRGRRASTRRAGRFSFPTWSRRKRARSSIRACKDRRTGRACRTVR